MGDGRGARAVTETSKTLGGREKNSKKLKGKKVDEQKKSTSSQSEMSGKPGPLHYFG